MGELIADKYKKWEQLCNERYLLMEKLQNKINSQFISIYSLQDETQEINIGQENTIHRADIENDIKSLISYAVGCMFGRYSLDKEGIVYAGGDFSYDNYKKFPCDRDNIIPICDDEYFEDDIVGRFVDFIMVVYGEDTLEENLAFIASALNGGGTSREIIRSYFCNSFYSEHLKTYQKTPIYWLFDSGKKNGFKCLIYIHRYQPDTIARIRTDYVHEQQARYRTAIEEITKRIESTSGRDKVKLSKKLNALKAQDEELHEYEEKIHHLADQMITIDLDDGVKHNYEIFKDVLAKIK